MTLLILLDELLDVFLSTVTRLKLIHNLLQLAQEVLGSIIVKCLAHIDHSYGRAVNLDASVQLPHSLPCLRRVLAIHFQDSCCCLLGLLIGPADLEKLPLWAWLKHHVSAMVEVILGELLLEVAQ